MDVELRFLRAMARAIDDYFMGAGPKPDDKAILAIAPELACLLASPKELEEEEENAVSEQRWIAVGERLPEDDCDVLIALPRIDGEFLVTTGYLSGTQRWFPRGTSHGWMPTHWRPLPAPPETK